MKYIYYIYDKGVLIGTTTGCNVRALYDWIRDNLGWTSTNSGRGPNLGLPGTMKTGFIYGRTPEKEYAKLYYIRETLKSLNERNKISYIKL